MGRIVIYLVLLSVIVYCHCDSAYYSPKLLSQPIQQTSSSLPKFGSAPTVSPLILQKSIIADEDSEEGSASGEVVYAPIVQALGGKIRGLVKEVEDSGNVYLYQGIRYGTAKRFHKPEVVRQGWDGVYDATTFRHACPQLSIPPGDNVSTHYITNSSSEDCLFLNIWRPAAEKQTRPVMVWIHTGGFMLGTIFSQTIDGRYLSSFGDVVVVTISYRVNALGFLYGGTNDSPGNLALHDQLLALRWIQDNIQRFGGDPNQVTLFGTSAGSMCVGALVLSPHGNGQFHRAIIQSGVPNSYLGSHDKKTALNLTHQLATTLQCTTQNNDEMIKCLQEKSIQDILVADWQLSQDLRDTIMRPIYGDEIVPFSPVEALKFGRFNHQIDLMYGVVKDEGDSYAEPLIPLITHRKADEEISLMETRKVIDNIMRAPEQYRHLNTSEIVDFYTKNLNDPTQIELRNAIYNAFGDFHIVCPTILFGEEIGKILANERKFYAYRLMQPLSIPLGFGCDLSMGVCHSTDIAYIFGLPIRFRGVLFTEDEYQLSRDMIRAWSSFAWRGYPGKMGQQDWENASEMRSGMISTRYMSLDVNDYKMVSGHFKETCNAFWKPRIFTR